MQLFFKEFKKLSVHKVTKVILMMIMALLLIPSHLMHVKVIIL